MCRVEIVDGLAVIVEWEIRAVVAPIGEVDCSSRSGWRPSRTWTHGARRAPT